jgi:hypothetical protein
MIEKCFTLNNEFSVSILLKTNCMIKIYFKANFDSKSEIEEVPFVEGVIEVTVFYFRLSAFSSN